MSGVLTQIQAFFSIDDALAGLLQTVFIIFYMIFAPLCGFLGDRYNRKWIVTVGIVLWIIAVLASSFVPSNVSILISITKTGFFFLQMSCLIPDHGKFNLKASQAV